MPKICRCITAKHLVEAYSQPPRAVSTSSAWQCARIHVCLDCLGTRIFYDRAFLLSRRESPMTRSPPSNLPYIPEGLFFVPRRRTLFSRDDHPVSSCVILAFSHVGPQAIEKQRYRRKWSPYQQGRSASVDQCDCERGNSNTDEERFDSRRRRPYLIGLHFRW